MSIRRQASLKNAIDHLTSLGMVRRQEEQTARKGDYAVLTGSFINTEDQVRVSYELRNALDEETHQPSMWLRFAYRSVGSGYRMCRGHRIHDTFGMTDGAAINKLYKNTKEEGDNFRLNWEIRENSPLKPYKFNAPQWVVEPDGLRLQHLFSKCCVMDAVSVVNGRVDREIAKPDNGEPFFIVCCSSYSGKEFWIVTDGEIFHPTSKINHARWLNGTQSGVVIRHSIEGVELKLATAADKTLITAAIQEFLK